MSRVVIGGATLAAAVAAGSAFTAANSLENNTVAGYDDATVVGATVNNIRYNPDTDMEKLASVVFTAAGDIRTTNSTMALLSGGTATADTSTCSVNPALVSGDTEITCTLTTVPLPDFISFDGVALTVVSD
jgi:hypothetical protein